MKGLFYKEARCLWHFGKTYLLMLVIFLGLALYQSTDSSGGAVWMLYPIFFAGTLPASLIGDDEKSGWQSCCDTLPIGRRQLVAAKYVTSAVLTALIITLVLLISALTGQPTVAGGTAVPLSTLIPLLLAVGLGVPALMFPVMFKFGATKGRAVYIAVVMIASATCGVLMASESVRGVLTVLPILPVIIITLAIFVGSWALSVKWFKAREL